MIEMMSQHLIYHLYPAFTFRYDAVELDSCKSPELQTLGLIARD